jgi:hypothetical protein
MGTQPRRMQDGPGQILLADAVINDILKEAIAAARQGAGQPQLRTVTKIPRSFQTESVRREAIHTEPVHTEPVHTEHGYTGPPSGRRLVDVIAGEPVPLAAVGGRRQ